jgi:hypothetical protein
MSDPVAKQPLILEDTPPDEADIPPGVERRDGQTEEPRDDLTPALRYRSGRPLITGVRAVGNRIDSGELGMRPGAVGRDHLRKRCVPVLTVKGSDGVGAGQREWLGGGEPTFRGGWFCQHPARAGRPYRREHAAGVSVLLAVTAWLSRALVAAVGRRVPKPADGHAGTTYGKFLSRRSSDTDGLSPEGTAVPATRDSITSGALSASVRPLRAAKPYVAGVPTT